MRWITWSICLLGVVVLTMAGGCGGNPQPAALRPQVSSPTAPTNSGAPRTFTTAKRTYSIRTEVDSADHDEVDELPLTAAAGNANDFTGKARKAAKLAVAAAMMEEFPDLKDLIESLPAELLMKNHTPLITTDKDSDRVAEEKRNVRVRAFLYAASREKDHDYHLIVGRDPALTPVMYMTMEISGLPPASAASHGKLKEARDSFKAFFGSNVPGMDYDFYDPPIPIEVEGSLFFDMNHVTGTRPGPPSLRPQMPVIWEVHPITKIVFEP